MKIVVVGFGSTGDVLPLVALSVGLLRAGHRVELVAEEWATTQAAQHGASSRVLAGSARDLLTSGSHGVRQAMASGQPNPQMLMALPRLHAAQWIDTLDEATADADLVVSNTLTVYHAASAAQDRGIPLVFAQLYPSMPTRDYPPPLLHLNRPLPGWANLALARTLSALGELSFRGAVNTVRRGRGRSPLHLDWRTTPVLAAWSPVLLPASADWPVDDVTITGPWRLPDEPWTPPTELAAFLDADEPPVFVGFGSMVGFDDADRLWGPLLEGLRGRRVLVSAGWAGFDAAGLPPDVRPVDWVPYAWLFPRCAAVIHHCGAGTTHAALASGTPTVPVPFVTDQPFWAARLRRLGAATQPLERKKLTPIQVRARVADTSDLTAQARALAALETAQPDGVMQAVHVIERVARA